MNTPTPFVQWVDSSREADQIIIDAYINCEGSAGMLCLYWEIDRQLKAAHAEYVKCFDACYPETS